MQAALLPSRLSGPSYQVSISLLFWNITHLKLAPIQFFGLMYNDFSDRLTDAECILDLLRTQPSITDSADAKSFRFRGGKVKFEGVSFAYKDGKNILEDITFDTLEATTTAFVGESGGGKTTITKLMQRLYDVDSGSILIDDQDIRQVTRNRYVKTAW